MILDGDVAQTLGALLREERGVASEVLVIDGITLGDFDYIDLGRIRMPSFTVPVTVKSLVFSEDPREVPADPAWHARRAHSHAGHHHHRDGHGHPHEHTGDHAHGDGHDHGHDDGRGHMPPHEPGLPAALRGRRPR